MKTVHQENMIETHGTSLENGTSLRKVYLYLSLCQPGMWGLPPK